MDYSHPAVCRAARLILAALCASALGCAASPQNMAAPKALGTMPVHTDEPTLVVRPFAHNGAARHLATWYPPGYFDPAKAGTRWPLVVFLHGRGECGTEGSKQTAQGLVAAAQLNPAGWPCVIIAPQKQAIDGQWVQDESYVVACLDATQAAERIDGRRIYLTGLSQGGAGTWAIGADKADRFAAIAPICGYGDPAGVAGKLTGTPIWAFHGAKDDVVPPAQSETMVAAIQKARQDLGSLGGPDADRWRAGPEPFAPAPKLTIFPDANHNSWDAAYRATGPQSLWLWMSGFSR